MKFHQAIDYCYSGVKAINRGFPGYILFACIGFVLVLGPKAYAQTAPASPPEAKSVISAPNVGLGSEAWTGDLDGILKKRYIRALVAYSKTQYYVVNGRQRGSSYEMLKAFEDSVNLKYPPKQKNLRFHVVFIPVSRDKMISRLAEGKGDIAVGTLTITPQRLKQVDFSSPLAKNVKEIAVTGPKSPALRSADDLSGQEVFVRKSSSYWEHIESLNVKLKSAGKAPVKLRPAPEDLEDEDLLEMLDAGLVPVVVVDRYLANLWSNVYKNIKPNPDVVLNDSGEVAWAVRKNTPKLMGVVNEFVATHKQGTQFGNVMIKRYALDAGRLKNAFAESELKKFGQTEALFQKYGSKYGMDYLLMMAQGYQESTLDQGVKSPVGAVGVMQVMPATGAEMNVGDIQQTEANIHAGVKYIRFMVDRYFAKEPMTDTNKVLFAFASYNAGPARIRKLRKEAADNGLDPNIWFSNVEAIAAARIGMETVTYVANIYKYYIAYSLIAKQEEDKRKAKQAMQKGH